MAETETTSPRPDPIRKSEAAAASSRPDAVLDYEIHWRDAEPHVRRVLADRLRGRPEIELEDVLQETRIYVFQTLHRYDSAYPFHVFATALAKNVVKRFLYPAPSKETSIETVSAHESALSLEKVPKFGATFYELLEIFFRWGGYPHQQVSFGFAVLLWGKPKRPEKVATKRKAEITASPERIVSELGPGLLAVLCPGLTEELEARGCDAELLTVLSRPMQFRLQMKLGDLFSGEPSLRGLFDEPTDLTGNTALAAFFGNEPRKSVSDWIRATRKRVERVFANPDSMRRIRLPHEPEWKGQVHVRAH